MQGQRAALYTAACALFIFAMAGCSSVKIGSAFDLQSFEKNVQRGVTTSAQVQTWLGPPQNRGVAVETSGEKFEQWMYYYGEGQLPSLSGSKWKNLEVKFDSNGIVRAYNWSSNP